jgi:hypothetical protein
MFVKGQVAGSFEAREKYWLTAAFTSVFIVALISLFMARLTPIIQHTFSRRMMLTRPNT